MFQTTRFLRHFAHKDILENFESWVAGFDVTKTAQVSMDGPNVSIKFLNVLQKQQEEEQFVPVNWYSDI